MDLLTLDEVLDTPAARALGDTVLPIGQVAKLLTLSKPVVYKLMQAGLLSYVQLTPGRRGVLASDVRAYLLARRVPADGQGQP